MGCLPRALARGGGRRERSPASAYARAYAPAQVRERRQTFEPSLLAEAVRAGEAGCEQPDEQRHRQADDVEVVALDPLDERRATALDCIAAGSALPLPARDVPRDVARCQLAERDERGLAVHLLPRRRHEREAGDGLVRSAGEGLEHLLGVVGAAWLAVDASGADDL